MGFWLMGEARKGLYWLRGFFFLMERNLRTNNKDTKGEIKANTAMEIVHTLVSVIKWEGALQTLV